MSSYTIAPFELTDTELEAVASMLAFTFRKPRMFTAPYLRWLYRDNPDGRAFGYNAIAPDGSIAAHYCMIPVWFHLNGEVLRAGLGINTATHPDHEGKWLFLKVAHKTIAEATEKGYAFLTGVANQNAEKLCLRLGYQPLARLDAAIGTGRSLQLPPANASFFRYWSQEAFEWRCKNPHHPYTVQTGKQHNNIYCNSLYPLVNAWLGSVPGHVSPKLDFLSKTKWNPFQLWMGLHPSVNGAPRGFIKIPERLKPSPLILMMKDLRGDLLPPDKNEILIQPADFDAF